MVRLGIVIVIFIGWEIAARWFIDPLFISPPSRVLASLGSVLDTAGVPAALRITFFELAVAFAHLGRDRASWSVSRSACSRSRAGASCRSSCWFTALPQITILPLFILFFGIGPASKIAFGVTHGVFPIIITVVAGVQNLKPILLTSARSMGASRWQLLR